MMKWKSAAVCIGAAAAGLSFPLFFNPSSSPPPPPFNQFSAAIHAVIRSSRAISTITLTAIDYKFSLHGLPSNSDEYRRKLSEVHLRSAERSLKLCEANRGFYVKGGQFVAALRQVPKEYSSILSSLQDQAVPCHFKAIKEVLIQNLGQDLSEIFFSFDENPIAAASIAQVHRAVLKDGHEVAVKVQYPGLQQQLKIDITTMSFLSRSVAWFKPYVIFEIILTISSGMRLKMFSNVILKFFFCSPTPPQLHKFFPEYRFEWLLSAFVEDIVLELDFVQEARNSEKAANNFKNNKVVKVPRVFWVDDVAYMKNKGIDPIKVAKVLAEVLAEMIFVHGFLHGDPHPGNILVSPEGPSGFSLVLLDHGIYRQLDEEFRLNYCELWKSLIVLDSNKIHHLGEQFGVAKYSSKLALGKGMSAEEKSNLKEELKSLKMEDISSFMESLPPDFLRILSTDGLLRSIINKLGASQRVRLLAYAKFALHGLSSKVNGESGR
ncbi:hypothetical protein L484_007808 [Morus notabilis]|uniref:ABC1 atypical kinase-like domain-containing protein n=1 Tax=Morus notabilis TaxID=981085 RepID=W9REG5_9ROSA|nr:hypothetical protein L484_007808 [Morus notabilis]